MVDFLPFRGVRYDTAIAGPMDRLICPPYDVISPAHERALLARSPHNMVRLELAELPGPASAERYLDAAKAYAEMQARGTLRTDDEPAYYLLRQRFEVDGRQRDGSGCSARCGSRSWGRVCCRTRTRHPVQRRTGLRSWKRPPPTSALL